MTSSGELAALFKAYDVRGVVPEELDERKALAIGQGFAEFCRQAELDLARPLCILVARDMRDSGVELSRAFIAGAESAGARVIDLGLASTDLLYFASGKLDAPGAMLTASHNPAQYNGMKFCLSGARPIGEDSGLGEVKAAAEAALQEPGNYSPGARPESLDLLGEFAAHVRSFIEPKRLTGLKVIADTANGMGGLIAPLVFSQLPCSLEILYGELDGSFPNHPADPIQPENLLDLRAAILERGGDVGLAFDGDADRVFLIDELGEPLPGSTTTAIVAKAMLERHPGATILYNCICSKSVPEVIKENGGIAVRTRVGHSFIKAVMAETGAVFGGEHSGHYYFAQNYRADSGIIAALVVLEVLADSGVSLSVLRRPFERYSASGEINRKVKDARRVLDAIEQHYVQADASIDFLDGLTVELSSWWFNLRPSNTEPLLRLNVEAADGPSCAVAVEEVVSLMERADSREEQRN